MTSYYFDISGPGITASASGVGVCSGGAQFLNSAIADGRLKSPRPATSAYESIGVPGSLLIELVRDCFGDWLRLNGERADVEALLELLNPDSYYSVEYGDI